MDKFAKLFERDDRQVLVRRFTNEDDRPCVSFETTTASGHRLCLTIEFARGEEAKCLAQRDQAFENCGEDEAFRVVEKAPGYDL